MNMIKNMIALSKKEQGATMVEYAIMVALIALVCFVMITGVGLSVNNTFSSLNSVIPG